MKTIKSDSVVFFDVDDTLVLWDFHPCEIGKCLEIGQTLHKNYVLPHLEHIKQLKQYKARGQTVIVWSASGWKWAKAVVERLNLEDYVDLVMCKPKWYYDDMPADSFMSRVYRKL